MAFQGKTLVAKADGERYWYKVDAKTGEVVVNNGQPYTPYQSGAVEYSYQIKNGARAGQMQEIRCSPRARLYVIVQELFEAGFMSCLEMHTGSWNDIRNIENQINMMAALSQGQIAYTPLVLTMYPETIMRTMDNGRKASKDTHLVKLEIDPAYAKAALARIRTAGVGMLPAGDPQEEDWEPDLDQEPYEDGEYTEAIPEELPADTGLPGSWTEFWENANAGTYSWLTNQEIADIVNKSGKDLVKTCEKIMELKL